MDISTKKKRSLLPKMFKVFSIYIMLTLSVFFGYVQIVGNLSNNSNSQVENPDNADAGSESAFDKFVAKMTGFENIDTGLVLSFDNGDMNLALQGNVAFDLGTMSLDIDVNMIYNQQNFDVKATYVSPNLYLAINENTYKFDTSSQGGDVDFSQILLLITKNLNFDTSALNDLGDFLGIDFNNFDVNELMSKLVIEDTQDEETGDVELSISLGKAVSAKIVCDSKYNIKTIKLKDIMIKGNSIKFSANVSEMNTDDIVIDYVETGDEIDMSGLTTYVGYSQNLFANNYVTGDVAVNVGENTYYGKLYYSNSESVKVKFETSFDDIDISLVYADENVYVDVAGLKLSVAVSDFDMWRETIDTLVERHTSKTTAEFVKELLNQYVDFDFENADIQNTIIAILNGGFANVDAIATYLPHATNLTENTFVMNWDNGLSVELSNQNGLLAGINVVYDNVSVNVVFAVAESGFAVEGDYFDVTGLLPLSDAIDEIVTAKQFVGQFELEVSEQAFAGKATVDFSNGIQAKVTTNLFGEDVEIYLNDNQLLIVVGDVKIAGDVANLNDYAQKIDTTFGTNISQLLDNSNLDVYAIIEKLNEITADLTLSRDDKTMLVVTYLSNIAQISLDGNDILVHFANEELKISATIYASNEIITMPSATDDIDDVLAKIDNVKNYVESNKFAFDLVLNYKDTQICATVQVDFENQVYDISNLAVGGNILNVRYQGGVVYVDYANNKLKAQVENVKTIADIVMNIVAGNGVDIDNEQNIDVEEILTTIFGEDVSTLSIKDLFDKLTLNVSGSLNNLTFDVRFASEKTLSGTLAVIFEENQFVSADITVDDINASITKTEFALADLNSAEYYDLTSKQSGTIQLSYTTNGETLEVVANVDVDLSDKIYAHITTTVLGEDIEITIFDSKLYAKVGELFVGTNFESAKEMYNYIVELFAVAIPDQSLDIEEILNNLDLNSHNVLDIEGLEFSILSNNFDLSYKANTNLTLTANLHKVDTLEIATIPDNVGDLKSLLNKVSNIKKLAEQGFVEFDFTATYNWLDFSGTFKYADGNIEISDMLVCGEYVNIRIQDNVVYFAYGNMKLRFDIPQASGESDTSLKDVLEKITSDTLAVEIDFGTFEEILNMLKGYTLTDYQNNLIVDITGDFDNIGLTLSNKKQYTISQILTANVTFKNDQVDTANVNVYDILTANVVLRNVESSTMSNFDAENYKDYSTDFVAGLFNSLEVEEDVYAFSSDIAIRYSSNTFYGKLTAMLVEDETYDGVLGKYVPYICVTTSSLGLSSYIYLVGETVYVDINGLQIKADLTQTTIDEILTFVEDNFGVTIGGKAETLDATVQAFKVILPAIDKVYGQWTTSGNGVQININDDLWYSKTSRFYDIVVKAFIENYQNTIVPTQVVLGANIDDPNTISYEDYSEYWLTDGEKTIEDDSTKRLNFAVYLDNITVGKFVENLDNIFIGTDFKNITALKSNDETTALTEFNDYTVALDVVKAGYDYITGMEYQAQIDVSISGATSMKVGGDVIVSVSDDTEKKAQYKLFDDKILKVQGDLDIYADYGKSSQVLHKLSLLYDNYDAGLFATYSHGDFVGNKDFKAKISNVHMSEIVAMIIKFADLNLSSDMKESFNIVDCSTDFRYLRSLLGMKKNISDDEVSEVDKILSSVTEMTKILKEIKLSKTEIEDTGLYQTTLSLKILWEEEIANVSIVLKEEKQSDNTTKLILREVNVSNFNFGGSVINASIKFEDYDASEFDYDTSAEHIDFSEISSFMDIAVNTLNTKGFSFTGSADVSIGSWDAITVEYDLFASLDDAGKIYLYLELDVPSFMDVTYDAGGFGHTYTYYSALSGFDNRISVLEYQDGTLTVTQTTYGFKESAFSSKKTKVKSWTHSIDNLGSEIMQVMAEALGLTDTVYNAISSLVASMNPNPSLEETILGFAKTDSGYTLKLDGETLTGSSSFNDFEIQLGLSDTYYDADGKAYKFIDSISTNVNIGGVVKIPVNLKSTNSGTSYTTGAGKTVYTNDYYRKMSIDESRYKQVYFVTKCSDAEFDSLMLVAGDKISFPTLTTKEHTVENKTTYYEFAGWYYDAAYNNAVTGDVYMADEELVFYAKWNAVKTVETRAVNVYNNGEFVGTMRVEAGDEIDMSNFEFVNANSGFYLDSELTNELTNFSMPDEDIDIYVVQKYVLNVYNNGELFGTYKYKVGDEVDLTALDFATPNTVFFADSTYQTQVSDKLTMTANETTIYATEKYTVTYTSAYGNNETVSYYGFAGDAITIPTQNSYEEFTETTKTIYTFLGYSEELTTIPNRDVTSVAKWNVEVETYYAVNVYNYQTLATTLRIKEGDTLDLSDFDFVKDDSQICVDSAFTTEITGEDYVVTEPKNIYVRNKYRVTITSAYGEAGTITYYDYQGTAIELPVQNNYVEDDGNTRVTYTFNGWTQSISTIQGEDVSISANWSVETKRYYTVTFDTTWTKPSTWIDDNNRFSGKITQKTAPGTIAPIKVLEGTTVDLTQYSTTAKYDYTAVWITASYTFEIKTWNTSGAKNISDGVSNYSYDKMDSLTVTGNITLYGTWGKA